MCSYGYYYMRRLYENYLLTGKIVFTYSVFTYVNVMCTMYYFIIIILYKIIFLYIQLTIVNLVVL